MPGKEEGFRDKLRQTFRREAEEHVRNISTALVALGADPARDVTHVVDAVFREAHSLKGSARVVGMKEIETLCRPLEDCLAALSKGNLQMSSGLLDALTLASDALAGLLPATVRGCTEGERAGARSAIQALEAALQGTAPQGPAALHEAAPATAPKLPPVSLSAPPPSETLRVASSTLESVLFQTNELVTARVAAREQARELDEAARSLWEWNGQWQKAVAAAGRLRLRLDPAAVSKAGSLDGQISRLLDFVDWNTGFFASTRARISALAGASQRDARALDVMVDSLQEDMKRTLMSPFSSLLEAFPRFVRELAREQQKEVQIEIHGEEIEIDRRILDELRDPLMHIVRNCVDHGIEPAEARARTGKPQRGRISFSITRQGTSQAEILVSDDGAGIDFTAIRSAAARSGVISPGQAEGETEATLASLIFQAGISTRRVVTDISGRGLGLAIARQKVEGVRGTISVETRRGRGSTFRIIVPMTLTDFRGVTVRAAEHLFVIPLSDVERVLRVARDEISTIENRRTIESGGRVLLLARLEDVLGLPRKAPADAPPAFVSAVVVRRADSFIALDVEEILGEHEVLVKPLGRHLARVRNIAGVTTLPSGRSVPVLHVPDLLRSAVRVHSAPPAPAAPAEETRHARILVVEDSITARALLRNILETAGYAVETAVDGADAFARAVTGQFDCIVSDVDMPRMNGFDLTARIRADVRLRDIPVILVTALESREQRERGIEVGASAYLIKSDFDQGNLVEIVRRMT